MQIPVGKVHKELLKHQDLWLKKSLIDGLWKLEMYTKGSITVCLCIYFLQVSTSDCCLGQGNGFCGPVLYVSPEEAGTSHKMQLSG